MSDNDWEGDPRLRTSYEETKGKLKEDKYLLEKLVSVLSRHCGEAGANEGALETAERLSITIKRLHKTGYFLSKFDEDTKWTQEEVMDMFKEIIEGNKK